MFDTLSNFKNNFINKGLHVNTYLICQYISSINIFCKKISNKIKISRIVVKGWKKKDNECYLLLIINLKNKFYFSS